MTNATLLEDAPGLTTTTSIVANLVSKFAGTIAVSCPELTKVVVSGVPPNCTTEEPKSMSLKKPDPLTVIVNCGAPGLIEEGLMVLTVGGRRRNATELEPLTDTCTVPTVLSRYEGTDAVTFVGLTNEVGIGVPFHMITLPMKNPVPVAVKARDMVPTGAEIGLSV